MRSGIHLSGFGRASAQLRNMKKQFAKADRSRGFMGTVRPYARFVNDGTRFTPPRHFMETGRARAVATIGRGQKEAQRIWDTASERGEQTALAMAEVWERKTKAYIREAGIVKTGALHRSMAIGRTVGELAQASRARGGAR